MASTDVLVWVRVSSARTGANAENPSPWCGAMAPVTSTTMFAAAELKTQTLPPSPISVTTPFDRVSPASKLTFDVFGRALPHGYTVRNPADSGPSTATLSATSVASAGHRSIR